MIHEDDTPAGGSGKNDWLRRHIGEHGMLALGLAAFSIFTMRGFDARLLFLFAFPMGLAFIHARSGQSKVGEAFLISVGVASLVAWIPELFPRLGHRSTLAGTAHDNRLITLYIDIYLFWLAVVLPIHLFGGSLRAKARGEPGQFSRFTCYLGLFTAGIFWLVILFSLPAIVENEGLWPIF